MREAQREPCLVGWMQNDTETSFAGSPLLCERCKVVGEDPASFYGWQMWIWLNDFYSSLPKEFPFKWRTNVGNFSLEIKNWLSATGVRKGWDEGERQEQLLRG